ncbi:MAG: hypothetical protein WBP85_13035 [Terracidiphilus sp.]
MSSVKMTPIPDTGDVLSKVRELLRDSPDMHVTVQHGIIDITQSGIREDILQTKIARLSLNADEQYSPRNALDAIVGSKELLSEEVRTNTRQVVEMGRVGSPPMRGRYHVPASLLNSTVDEDLNQVLRAFPGIIVYGDCTRPNGNNLIDVEYFTRRNQTPTQILRGLSDK